MMSFRPVLLSTLLLSLTAAHAQNVGVGVPAPQEKLDIAGRLRLSSDIGAGAPTGGAGTIRWNGSLGQFQGWNGSSWTSFASTVETDPIFSASPSFGITNTDITNWNTAFGWGNHATVGYLTSFTELDPTWNGPANSTGAINRTGNVAIGAAVPLSRLHVNGNQIGSFTGSTRGMFSMEGTTTNGGFAAMDFIFADATNPIARIAAQSNGFGSKLMLGTSNDYATGITNTALTINENGNVGIGISAPSDRLHVVGNIRMVDGNQATGFVPVSDANGRMTWTDPTAVVTAEAWSLSGNASTVDGTHFIGTTDNIPFNIRVNNQKAGRVASTGEVFLGYQAGNVNTSNSSTGVGYNTLLSNTTGANNTAMGREAMRSNTTGNDNTAVGKDALRANTTGIQNTAIGKDALLSNTTGVSNVANGFQALLNNTTGNDNTAVGRNAMSSNTTGIFNSALGSRALQSNTTGSDNTAAGRDALRDNTTGGQNTAIGKDAMLSNTTGSSNAALGFQALVSNTTGNDNTAVGRDALRTNTTGGQNTAIGKDALRVNTSGFNNAAIGVLALVSNTTGSNNTAMGRDALRNNTTGNFNSALGSGAMYSNTTGLDNTAMGKDALRDNTQGIRNTAIGKDAMLFNTTGNSNVALGYLALYNNTTGSGNIAMGDAAGDFNTTGSQNTFLGINADASVNNLTNATAIGSNAVVGASNSVVLGNGANVGIGESAPLERLHVSGNVLLSRGGAKNITLQKAVGSSDGSALSVKAGDASSDSGARSGGDLVLEAGAGYNLTGTATGGDLLLRSGTNQLSAANSGGDIILQTGSVSNSFIERMRISQAGVFTLPTLNGSGQDRLLTISPAGVVTASNINTANVGTVTSVGLTMPSGLSVGSSPVTGSGTIAVTTTLNGPVKGNGSGFTAGAIGLASAEVTGILPIANGGTNSNAAPTNGGLAYGTGSAYAFTAAGTSGQLLRSNGAGAPTWSDPTGIITVENGLTETAPATVRLGGALTQATTVSGLSATNKLSFTGNGVDVFNVDGSTLSVDATNDRVGIGITAPTAKLDVNGKVRGVATFAADESSVVGSTTSTTSVFTGADLSTTITVQNEDLVKVDCACNLSNSIVNTTYMRVLNSSGTGTWVLPSNWITSNGTDWSGGHSTGLFRATADGTVTFQGYWHVGAGTGYYVYCNLVAVVIGKFQ